MSQIPLFAEDLAGEILQCVLHLNSTPAFRTSGGYKLPSASIHPDSSSFPFTPEEISAVATHSSKNYLNNLQLDTPLQMDYIYFGPGPAKLPREVCFNSSICKSFINCN
jgi:hypothetical protein